MEGTSAGHLVQSPARADPTQSRQVFLVNMRMPSVSVTSPVHMDIQSYDKLWLLGLIQDPWRGNRKPSVCFYDLLVRPPLTIPVISGLRDRCHVMSVGCLSFCKIRTSLVVLSCVSVVFTHAGKKGLSLYQPVPPSLCLNITEAHIALFFWHCLMH